MTPLYGHDSSETAYIVDNYPYGNKRCRCKFWLEYKQGHGFRIVSQTEHPITGKWNKPRLGTYHRLAGCLYLDDKQHVNLQALNEYNSDANNVLEFLQNFPNTIISIEFKLYVVGRKKLDERIGRGENIYSIKGTPCLPTQTEIAKAIQSIPVWEQVIDLLKTKFNE